jgi:hypothetical protein
MTFGFEEAETQNDATYPKGMYMNVATLFHDWRHLDRRNFAVGPTSRPES